MSGSVVIKGNYRPVASRRARKVFKGKVIANGGFEPDTAAAAVAQGAAAAIPFGRYFVSNPDLPRRVSASHPLAAYVPDYCYNFGLKATTASPCFNSVVPPLGPPGGL